MGSEFTGLKGTRIRVACRKVCEISSDPTRLKYWSARRESSTGTKWATSRSCGVRVRSTGITTRIAQCVERPHNLPRRARAWGGRFAGIAALLLAAYLLLSDRAILAAQSPTEYQVKAAYLFNFLKFVEWPDDPAADPHGKWVIGIVGDSPIGRELAQLVEGKDVQGRELQVKKFQAAENLRACNILFISESEKGRVPSILAALRGSSVLTVADMDNFIGSGGMIQFVMEDARVRVAIDVGAAGRARLKVSSKLLSLAHVVTGTDRSANN